MFFLIAWIGIAGEIVLAEEPNLQSSERISEEQDMKPVLDAFNESVEQEAKRKLEEADQAEKEGKIRDSQVLIRQAMLLETLKVEEGRISEEKILSLKDQMSSREKKDWIKRFIQEGDRLASLGLYDLAVDEYEKAFLLEPENRIASRRIDQSKKQFIKEQRKALNEEGRMIDRELKARVEVYINQAEELIQAGNYEVAKRTLERVFAVDRKNKKAKKLFKQVNAKLAELKHS